MSKNRRKQNNFFIPLTGKELAKKIAKKYKQANCKLDIISIEAMYNGGYLFKIRPKCYGKMQKIMNLTEEIRISFKRPFQQFSAFKDVDGLFLVVSELPSKKIDLFTAFETPSFSCDAETMQIPIIIGSDLRGRVIVQDLSKLIHVLVGGTSGSGKTVFLQCIIASIIVSRTPDQVNLLIFNTKSAGLDIFDGVPHLSYPVIEDNRTAAHVILALREEMNRRYQARHEDWPYLVCVIDEASAYISDIEDKKIQDITRRALTDMLRRGRKVGIIWVLAAQDPTKENLNVELANISTKVAFRCAKSQNSVTILGEAGAENLVENGDMLFKCQGCPAPMRLQGAYPEQEDLEDLVTEISKTPYDTSRKFVIPEPDLSPDEDETVGIQSSSNKELEKDQERNQEFCSIICWTLGREEVSALKVMEEFNIGNRASKILKKMEELGIVSEQTARKPRQVLCKRAEDLSEDALDFLTENGISLSEIKDAFHRNDVATEVDDE